MNLWKYIFAMTVTSGLFLVACSDSTANPITTSRSSADEEGVEKDSNAKSSSSVKKESKDSKSSSSKAKSSSSVKQESEDSKSSSSKAKSSLSMSAIESSESSSSDDKAPSSSSSQAQGEDSVDWGTCATTEAFIEKGETVGGTVFYDGETEVGYVELISDEDVEKRYEKLPFLEWLFSIFR